MNNIKFLIEDFCNPQPSRNKIPYWGTNGWINPLRFRYRVKSGLISIRDFYDTNQHKKMISTTLSKYFIKENIEELTGLFGDPDIQSSFYICDDDFLYFQRKSDLTHFLLLYKG